MIQVLIRLFFGKNKILYFSQSHEIHNLETYTQYLVSLQVFNPEGPGPATTVLVMTDEGGEFYSLFFYILQLNSIEIETEIESESYMISTIDSSHRIICPRLWNVIRIQGTQLIVNLIK